MKKLSILAICFIGLAVFVYFYEIEGEDARKKAEELEQSLFRIEDDEVIEIEISLDGADTVQLKKEGEQWKLQKPIDSLADNGTVDSFISSVTGAERERILENASSKLDDYGLQETRSRLSILTADSKKELLIGNKDFTGN
jgi:hypothetical protein